MEYISETREDRVQGKFRPLLHSFDFNVFINRLGIGPFRESRPIDFDIRRRQVIEQGGHDKLPSGMTLERSLFLTAGKRRLKLL